MTQFFDSRLASFPSHASFHFIVAKKERKKEALQDVRFLVLSV